MRKTKTDTAIASRKGLPVFGGAWEAGYMSAPYQKKFLKEIPSTNDNFHFGKSSFTFFEMLI